MEIIILAGGKGTRLRSVIGNIPKPMALINGIPFLEKQLEWLLKQGATHFIISVGYQYKVITEYFGSSFKEINITYIIEKSPLGTGGAISLASKSCTSDNFFVINGDTFYPINLVEISDSFQNEDLALATKFMPFADRYGLLNIKKGKVVGFEEKKQGASGLINAGIYYLSKRFSHKLPDKAFSFEYYLQNNITLIDFLAIEPKKKNNLFIDIGIPEDYDRAQKLIN